MFEVNLTERRRCRFVENIVLCRQALRCAPLRATNKSLKFIGNVCALHWRWLRCPDCIQLDVRPNGPLRHG